MVNLYRIPVGDIYDMVYSISDKLGVDLDWDLRDYALESDCFRDVVDNDEEEEWTPTDAIEVFSYEDPKGYERAVREIVKGYIEDGRLDERDIEEYFSEEG